MGVSPANRRGPRAMRQGRTEPKASPPIRVTPDHASSHGRRRSLEGLQPAIARALPCGVLAPPSTASPGTTTRMENTTSAASSMTATAFSGRSTTTIGPASAPDATWGAKTRAIPRRRYAFSPSCLHPNTDSDRGRPRGRPRLTIWYSVFCLAARRKGVCAGAL